MSQSTSTAMLSLASDKVPKKTTPVLLAPILVFAKKLVSHPNVKKACQMIEEQAALLFDQHHGAELEQAKQQQAEHNTRWEASSRHMDELEKRKANTKQWIKTGLLNSGKEKGDVSWQDWRTKDQVLLIITLFFLALAVFMGASNVYANLMASGEPVFIENPYLAMALASLMPISSAAIKFVTNFMTYSTTRRWYALGVYSLTLLSILVWSVLFATTFTGVASGIDWSAMLDGGHGSAGLVWTQLATELLAASALALAAEDTYLRYAPDWWTQNPEYNEIEQALKVHLPEHEKLRKERAETHGRIVELSATRQAAINEAIAEYLAMRSRYAAAND